MGQGKSIKRAYDKGNRNKHWRNIVAKHGYFVVVRISGLSKEEADKEEISLIAQYGRFDKGEGCLTNQTDGGEGSLRLTDSQKEAIRLSNATRRLSEGTIAKMAAAQRGKTASKETKDRQSRKRKGVPHSDQHRYRLALANKLRFNKITLQEYTDAINTMVHGRILDIQTNICS